MIRFRSIFCKVFFLATAFCGSTAYAQTFDERFSAFSLRTTGPTTTFAAPEPTAPPMFPAAAVARPAARAGGNAAAAPVAIRARQEELLVSAYAPEPSAPAALQNPFAGWLPRLLPTAVETVPESEGALPAEVETIDRGIISERGPHARRVPDDLAALIAAKAHKHRVPISLAHAVVTVESNYNPRALGRGATIGLMQIKHPTARSLGFAGTVQELYDPATNLEYGMNYLGQAHRLAKGDICGTIMRYQGGLRAPRMSRDAAVYCSRVQRLLAAAPKRERVAAQPGPRRVAESVTR